MEEKERIGFGRRLGALLLDGLITGAIVWALMTLGVLDMFTTPLTPEQQEAMQSPGVAGNAIMESMITFGTYTAAIAIVSLLYGTLEIFLAASPGKMILGIQIADQEGYQAKKEALALRYLLKGFSNMVSVISAYTGIAFISIIGGLASFAFLIGCFLALGDTRLALHDIIAKTAIYRKEDVE